MKISRALVLLMVVLLAAACGTISPEVTPFYTPPEPLPRGKPGEIIKTEVIETNSPDLQAWRVMYHSRDLNGSDAAVTGLFAAPTAPPPSGGYPLLALAHGTEGLARKCAPSLDSWGLPPLASDYLSFPDSTITPFLKAGFAVTATDYQGLGAPGNSSFLVGSVEAQNVLDSIRAIRSFDAVQLNDQNFLWGHSQGGHSAAFTAQLGQEIAPEIKLSGIALVAPAAELKAIVDTVLKSSSPTPLTGVAVSVAASWNQTYGVPLDSVLTPAGIKDVPHLFQDCVIGEVITYALQPPNTYYFADPTTTSPWSDTMILNIPKGVLYPAPVFVGQGVADIVIAPQAAQAFVKRLCDAGNRVQFNFYAGADHLSVIKDSNADVLAWFLARTKQEDAPSNCPVADVPATP
jgi:acetyl esterase/lipase